MRGDDPDAEMTKLESALKKIEQMKKLLVREQRSNQLLSNRAGEAENEVVALRAQIALLEKNNV